MCVYDFKGCYYSLYLIYIIGNFQHLALSTLQVKVVFLELNVENKNQCKSKYTNFKYIAVNSSRHVRVRITETDLEGNVLLAAFLHLLRAGKTLDPYQYDIGTT